MVQSTATPPIDAAMATITMSVVFVVLEVDEVDAPDTGAAVEAASSVTVAVTSPRDLL